MSMMRVDLVLCTENAFKMDASADNEFIFIFLVIDDCVL